MLGQEYLEKFKDPRWQQLRLKVFERDKWTCQFCEATDKTLNAHHWYYSDGCEPWEYDLDALVTLCQDCHDEESRLLKKETALLVSAVRRMRWSSAQINNLACSLVSGEWDGRDEDLNAALGFVLRTTRYHDVIRLTHKQFLEQRQVPSPREHPEAAHGR
jgi:hypothetical protein